MAGKTHLATALGFAACGQGRRVRFFGTTGLVTQLLEAREDRRLERLLKLQRRSAGAPLGLVVSVHSCTSKGKIQRDMTPRSRFIPYVEPPSTQSSLTFNWTAVSPPSAASPPPRRSESSVPV